MIDLFCCFASMAIAASLGFWFGKNHESSRQSRRATCKAIYGIDQMGRQMRRGISLLEVLIAIGLVAVGLLGVAALIPIGTFYSAEANKSIRGWDMGQLATRQVQVHDMLNPNRWVDAGGYRPLWDSAFVIDPYFFARNESVYATSQANAQNDARYWFPYRSTDDSGTAATYQVARMSLRTWRQGPPMFAEPFSDANGNRTRDAGEAFTDMPQVVGGPANGRWDDLGSVAERIFTGSDDVVLEAPNADLRPLPLNMVEDYTDSDGNGVYDAGEPFADLNGDGLWTDQTGTEISAGDYSWFLTATPASYPANNNTYLVSTVILYKRATNFAPLAEFPGERTVFCDIQDSAIGGGRSVLLWYVSDGDSTNYLDIKANTWLMLTGTVAAWNPVTGTTVPRKLIRWYRIVSIGEPEDDPPATQGTPRMRRRRATLQGADISNDYLFPTPGTGLITDQSNVAPDLDPQFSGTDFLTIHATIVTGVVNVFERTVEIEPR